MISKKDFRIALFAHDAFGPGHARRSFIIIHALAERLPEASIMLLTGSAAPKALKGLPPNADLVKIPAVIDEDIAGPETPHLRLSLVDITQMRRRIIKEAVLAFSPDTLIVEDHPLGFNAELLPLLKSLNSMPTKTMLGLRDIWEAPEAAGPSWEELGIYTILEHYYDRILVYGRKDAFDQDEDYEFPPLIAKKTRYCGCLERGEEAGKKARGDVVLVDTMAGLETAVEEIIGQVILARNKKI
jgi:predicted glycosyltransferase